MTEQNLKHLWHYEKMLSLEDAAKRAEELRAQGKTIVTINGSFDLLQAGHLDFIEEAKQQGDVLFVGTNSDESIKGAKGPTRPIIPQEQRVAMLAALQAVDYVTVFSGSYEEEPHGSFLPAIKPNVHVNGSDYGEPETWIEWPVMQQFGTKPYKVARRPNLSTSQIIEKIVNSSKV